MNKVILIGRLTKDPELRKTPTDVSVCQFTKTGKYTNTELIFLNIAPFYLFYAEQKLAI